MPQWIEIHYYVATANICTKNARKCLKLIVGRGSNSANNHNIFIQFMQMEHLMICRVLKQFSEKCIISSQQQVKLENFMAFS